MKKLIYLSLGLILIGCAGKESFTTENGTEVVYFEEGNGDTPVDSLVCLFTIRYTTEEGEVMMDLNEPRPLQIDPNSELDQGELFNVLRKLKIGDSVRFDLVASELFSKTFKAPLPDSIEESSKIKFQVAFKDQLTVSGYYEYAEERAKKAAEKQLIIDQEILENHFSENEIDVETTESGLCYVITEEGSGPIPDSGQVVRVNYVGRVLEGDYFDSSHSDIAKEKGFYNAGREPYEPYAFPLGQGQVIKGWDEGIALLKEGSKATLYIPSPLGYGNRGSGRVIKPNSILVFDVELVEIVQKN